MQLRGIEGMDRGSRGCMGRECREGDVESRCVREVVRRRGSKEEEKRRKSEVEEEERKKRKRERK